PDAPFADLPRRESINRGLVKTGNRAERSGDEMKLILNNQTGRIERPVIVETLCVMTRFSCAIEAYPIDKPIYMAEKRASLANPWQARKFINCRDQKGG